MAIKIKDLSPKERKAVFIIRNAVVKQREAEFYAIHGDKRNNHEKRDLAQQVRAADS